MSLDRAHGAAFVDGYGRTWQNWDYDGFVALFSDDAVYVEHPVDETVVGRDEIAQYIRREHEQEGVASVRMGEPKVDGDQVVAEFWTTMTNGDTEETLAGCFIARLDPENGLCTHFRQYWFEFPGHVAPFEQWGT